MKHARPDYDRFQDPAGKIPADEPVFLLRGQDPLAGAAVRFWARRLEENGGDPAMVSMAREHARRMDAWTCKRKLPDLPQGGEE